MSDSSGGLSNSHLAKAVAQLSEIYGHRRERLSASLLQDPMLRQAYLLYFLPANLAKMKSILKEISAHPASPEFMTQHPRILDLGCGPGTLLLSFLDHWIENRQAWDSLECVAVDSVRANLHESQFLFSRHAARLGEVIPSAQCRLHTEVADLTRLHSLRFEGSFDFIILGNVLNELFSGPGWLRERQRLVSTVVTRWLAPSGFLVLLEPALKETSRQLLQLRDLLLATTDLKIYSPCVHGGPCPAIGPENPNDWCHEDRPWDPPEVIREVDRLVGNRKDSLKFSYVVMTRLGISVRDARFRGAQRITLGPAEAAACPFLTAGNHPQIPSNPAGGDRQPPFQGERKGSGVWRVVSELMEEKGKASVFLCGEGGRLKVTRMDKHRSGTNQLFAFLRRGQVVHFDGMGFRGDKEARVEPATRVTIEYWETELPPQFIKN